ncbi:MAG TPA: hypothetical protein VFB85_03760 [Vicinamibacterales bacterium]|nr:hypothetical protein [Vicinamibacterales bacterium]
MALKIFFAAAHPSGCHPVAELCYELRHPVGVFAEKAGGGLNVGFEPIH